MNLYHALSDHVLIIIILLAACGGGIVGAILTIIMGGKNGSRQNHQRSHPAGRSVDERLDGAIQGEGCDCRPAMLGRVLNEVKAGE